MHLRSGEGEPDLYMSVSTPFSSTTKPDDMSSSFTAFSKTSFQTKSSVLSQMSSPGSRRFGLLAAELGVRVPRASRRGGLAVAVVPSSARGQCGGISVRVHGQGERGLLEVDFDDPHLYFISRGQHGL